MADLDDFFAKKDRKKSKAKKFTTTEEIARKMEETGRKAEKPKKDKTAMLSSNFGPEGDDLSGNNEEDEEWKVFKEEKKDYTGLKIQNLNLQDYDDSDDNEGDYDGEFEDNDSQDANSRKKGPWKVVENVDNQPPPAVPEKKVESPPPVGKSYVPPALRKQANRERLSRPVGKPEAPDITNQEFFPTLSAANSEPSSSWKRKQDAGFEEVRNSRSHSSRNDPTRTPQTVRLDENLITILLPASAEAECMSAEASDGPSTECRRVTTAETTAVYAEKSWMTVPSSRELYRNEKIAFPANSKSPRVCNNNFKTNFCYLRNLPMH